MSTSISLHVEKRAKESEPWQYVGDDFYHDQDYLLFALLAGVRNRHGITPLAPPRGFPGDASPELRARYSEEGRGGHSASYFTVMELNKAPWSKGQKKSGIVDAKEYAVYRARGAPSSYSQGVMGWSILLVPEEEMRRRYEENDWIPRPEQAAQIKAELEGIERSRQRMGMPPLALPKEQVEKVLQHPSYHSRVEWGFPLKVQCEGFYALLKGPLKALGASKNVRCVFWFHD
jgi:hypothetical protein